MAITKSAKKAIRSSENKRVFNIRTKRKVQRVEKQITKLLDDGKVTEASKLLPEAYKQIDKSTKKNLLKANTASRRKSKLSRMIKAAESK